jgi:hypothetical protein
VACVWWVGGGVWWCLCFVGGGGRRRRRRRRAFGAAAGGGSRTSSSSMPRSTSCSHIAASGLQVAPGSAPFAVLGPTSICISVAREAQRAGSVVCAARRAVLARGWQGRASWLGWLVLCSRWLVLEAGHCSAALRVGCVQRARGQLRAGGAARAVRGAVLWRGRARCGVCRALGVACAAPRRVRAVLHGLTPKLFFRK